jgi:prolyl-tRNA synthetase
LDDSGKVKEISEKLYQDLQQAGLEVLFDDRDESPGVKFNDADLIGIPLRITVGNRALKEGGVEVKLRHKKDKELVPLDNVIETVQVMISELYDEIKEYAKEVSLE